MEKNPEVDDHKLILHPKRVSEWYEKGDCYPIYVEIGTTNRCNHRCIFCALDFLEKAGDFINTEVMLKTLREMAEKGVKSVMFAGEGEPLLHKDIGLFTQKAKQYGLDVSITTNGILLTKEKIEQCLPNLSWIRFSVDSGSPENYALVHGTSKEDFGKLLNNIREAVIFRNESNLNTTIGVQFLLIPQNVDYVIKLAETLKEIGADNLQIKPYSQHPKSINKFIINYEDYAHLGPELKKFDSEEFKIIFRKKTMERLQEGASYDFCYGLPFFALIDAKGNIIPCNLFYSDSEFIYGNLYENSFIEIWESEKRKKILEKLKKLGVKNCRGACRLNPINKYLHRLKNPKPHDNFV